MSPGIRSVLSSKNNNSIRKIIFYSSYSDIFNNAKLDLGFLAWDSDERLVISNPTNKLNVAGDSFKKIHIKTVKIVNPKFS